MSKEVLKIGITGAPASGKSFIANIVTNMGYQVFDADLEVKKLYHDAEICAQVADLFPEMQGIDKVYIANIIYNNHEKRQRLNAIFHPVIRNLLAKFIEENKNSNVNFADIPLLYEADFRSFFDCVICAYADNQARKRRFMEKYHLAFADVLHLIERAQLPLSEKMNLSDFVLDTQKPENEIILQIKNIINKVKHD